MSLFKMFVDVILTVLLVLTCKKMEPGSLFKICFVVSVMPSTVPPLRNCLFTLCIFVVSASSLISDISESHYRNCVFFHRNFFVVIALAVGAHQEFFLSFCMFLHIVLGDVFFVQIARCMSLSTIVV